MKKYSKNIFRMNKQNGIEISGEFSPFLRFCFGASILIFSTCIGLAALVAAIPWHYIFK